MTHTPIPSDPAAYPVRSPALGRAPVRGRRASVLVGGPLGRHLVLIRRSPAVRVTANGPGRPLRAPNAPGADASSAANVRATIRSVSAGRCLARKNSTAPRGSSSRPGGGGGTGRRLLARVHDAFQGFVSG